jgi:hypothetical protein
MQFQETGTRMQLNLHSTGGGGGVGALLSPYTVPTFGASLLKLETEITVKIK